MSGAEVDIGAGSWSVIGSASRLASQSASQLNVDGRFARLGNRVQRVARSGTRHDPFLLAVDDVQKQLVVRRSGQPFLAMLRVFILLHRFAGMRMKLLPRPTPDGAD